MKNYFLIKTIFGPCYLIADKKWKRSFSLGPWIGLLIVLGLSMAFTAESSIFDKFGNATIFVAIGIGAMCTFVLHAAFISWFAIRNIAVMNELARKNINAKEVIDWKLFQGCVILLSVIAYYILRRNY